MENCHKCHKKSELFDVLTQLYFCGNCYQKALKHDVTFTTWPHVRQRLQERYDLCLTVNMYREMISQIQNINLSTYDENSRKNISGKNTSGHLVYIEDKVILVVYLKLDRGLKGCILTALPPICIRKVSIDTSCIKRNRKLPSVSVHHVRTD